jgi:hypothetical protein
MPLVDPGGDGQQLHGADIERDQMVDDRRMCQSPERTAIAFRNIRVQHGEGTDGKLVNQTSGHKDRLAGVEGLERLLKHGLGDQPCRVLPKKGEARVVGEGPVEPCGVGVNQQLCRVEPIASFGPPRTLRAQTIALARLQALHKAGEQPITAGSQIMPGGLIVGRIKNADRNPSGAGCLNTKTGPGGREFRSRLEGRNCLAAGRHQVMTEGASRPVRSRIPASVWAASISGASAACVS